MTRPEPLALVGIGCRFPRGDGPDAFFGMLERGESAVTVVPRDRFDVDAVYDPDRDAPGKTVSRWGAFLDDVASFDWQAFGMSPREAQQMDPQHRLMLEVAWEALEDAGLPLEKVAGTRTGVYVGAFGMEYGSLATRHLEQIDPYTLTGNQLLFNANRLSHFFDFRGPSLVMDVACAASLVAFHYACQDLWNGETELALAGGVNVLLTPSGFVARSKAGVLSPDGRCKTFDAAANGFVSGEGAGVVVLKPLARAVADGDRIYALVRGTALNHNGRTPWIQAVSPRAQEALIRAALERAGVDRDEVDYVELHGTGTTVGDPVEARALAQVFERKPPARPLLVGSVKTNLGHLASAGSIAHLIKVALSLHRATILPSINLTTVNPEIPLQDWGLEVPRKAAPWPSRGGAPRIAGVTSLALGGANAHAVLQQAPEPEAPPARGAGPGPGPLVLPLSARSGAAVQRLAAAHAERVRALGDDAAALWSYCRAAARRRTHHPIRAAAVAASGAALAEKLDALSSGAPRPPARSAPRALFVFSGQGQVRAGMGLQLAAAEPVVKRALDELDGKLRAIAGWSLWEVLQEPPEKTRLDQPQFAQPAQVAVQLAIAALWRASGVEPEVLVGHSLGEIPAAVVAGALDVDQGLRLAALRGRLMARPDTRGKMAQVRLPPEEVERALADLGGRAVVAVVNGPRATVISGEAAAVEAAVAELERRGASARFVATDIAFHSPPMAPLGEALAAEATWLTPRPAQKALLSTLTGARVEGPELTAAYWGRQIREKVAFLQAFQAALAEGVDLVVEVSAHPLLQEGMVEAAEAQKRSAGSLFSLRKGAPEALTFRESLGAAYERGAAVRWDAVYPGTPAHGDLPTYRWERQRCWLPPPPRQRAGSASRHPLLGDHVSLAGRQGEHVFCTTVSLEDLPFLADHRVQGNAVMPAAAYVEMAVQAACAVLGTEEVEVRDLELHRPLLLEPEQPTALQLTLTVKERGGQFQVHARSGAPRTGPGGAPGEEPWTAVAQGSVRALDARA
ncbi:MAG TPA: type I polyketide synthase [Myxococcales bacterium]|nr:type I polyketide synthase [Myxococcales bacterium]